MPRVIVKGYRETDRAFRKAGKEHMKEFRAEMKKVAEPIAAEARSRLSRYQGASLTTIRPVALAKGVAVRQYKGKVTGLRPDFGAIEMRHGLVPALADNQDIVIRGAEEALDRIANRAGF